MSQILNKLVQALAKMPSNLAPEVNADILLTLLFWRLMSSWSCGSAKRRDSDMHMGHAVLARITASNLIGFTHETLYESCQWDKPMDAMLALRDALYRWINAQPYPTLLHLLRPERFSMTSPIAPHFLHSTVLADVIKMIGSIDPVTDAPGLTIGEIFSKAMQTLMLDATGQAQAVAQLLVDVMRPLPVDTVYDPLCGQGLVLMACVDTIQSRFTAHRLQVVAQEPDTRLAALAQMQLLTHGVVLHQLHRFHPLSATPADRTSLPLGTADIVLLRVPETNSTWSHDDAANQSDKRFPVTPPADSRMALIWHGLAHLKSEQGRMGVILPLGLLASPDGLLLRRYLVEHKHLVAVIELPGLAQQGQLLSLLVMRQHHPSNLVAFISGMPAIAGEQRPTRHYDAPAVLAALDAFQSGQPAPWLRVMDDATIAQHGYQFNLPAYLPWRLSKP